MTKERSFLRADSILVRTERGPLRADTRLLRPRQPILSARQAFVRVREPFVSLQPQSRDGIATVPPNADDHVI